METRTDQKVDFGRLTLASEVNSVKEWEKIFDEEWAKPVNDIALIIEYITAWRVFTPPSRRPILLEKILNEVEDLQSLSACLTGMTSWEDDEREILEKAWDNASARFVLSEASIIILANSLSILAPNWRIETAETISKEIAAEENDQKVKEYFLEIKNPGNLSDKAYRRFLAAAANKEEAEEMIMKLSWAENKNDSGKANSRPLAVSPGRDKTARKLWKEVLISKFLKTRTIAEAEKMINDFVPNGNRSDLLMEIRACQHLAMLINDPVPPEDLLLKMAVGKHPAGEKDWYKEWYETGKRVYLMVISIHGKNSLAAFPIMASWSEFVIYHVKDHATNEELSELYEIVTGEVKNIIAETYLGRLKQQWYNQLSDQKSETLEKTNK